MRFFIKTACNFLSVWGNLNSLEDVADEVNDGDQKIQPQMENPNRKKQKKQKKREYVQDQLIEIHQEHLVMLERSEKRHQEFMERMVWEQKEQDQRERERDNIFSRTRQIIYQPKLKFCYYYSIKLWLTKYFKAVHSLSPSAKASLLEVLIWTLGDLSSWIGYSSVSSSW